MGHTITLMTRFVNLACRTLPESEGAALSMLSRAEPLWKSMWERRYAIPTLPEDRNAPDGTVLTLMNAFGELCDLM